MNGDTIKSHKVLRDSGSMGCNEDGQLLSLAYQLSRRKLVEQTCASTDLETASFQVQQRKH